MTRMSSLKDRLRADLTTAMKARDELRSSTLRMVLAAVTNAEVAGKTAKTLSDDEVIGVLTSETKKRREAATAAISLQSYKVRVVMTLSEIAITAIWAGRIRFGLAWLNWGWGWLSGGVTK